MRTKKCVMCEKNDIIIPSYISKNRFVCEKCFNKIAKKYKEQKNAVSKRM